MEEQEEQYQELTVCLVLKYYLGCYCCCSAPVAPEPVKPQRTQFIGEGFFIEEIFDHMIEKVVENDKARKKKSRFKFRVAGKLGRYGAAEVAKKAKAMASKRKFKSVGKITQLGAMASRNAGNTESIEEVPEESTQENKRWHFKAVGKLSKMLGMSRPEEDNNNIRQAQRRKSFKSVGKATQMGVAVTRHNNGMTPIDG